MIPPNELLNNVTINRKISITDRTNQPLNPIICSPLFSEERIEMFVPLIHNWGKHLTKKATEMLYFSEKILLFPDFLTVRRKIDSLSNE